MHDDTRGFIRGVVLIIMGILLAIIIRACFEKDYACADAEQMCAHAAEYRDNWCELYQKCSQ